MVRVKSLARLVFGRGKKGPSGPPQFLIFDFDGTIADTFEAGFEILNTLAREFGFRELARADLERARGMRTHELMKFLGIPLTRMSRIARRGSEELRARIDSIQPLPGVPEALAALQAGGFRLGIITSNTGENVARFLQNHRLEIFEFVRSSSKLMGKAREIRAAMKQIDLHKEEILFVGDETRDIEAAHKAGIPIAAVTWGYNSRASLEELKPQMLFEKPEQLVAALLAQRAAG